MKETTVLLLTVLTFLFVTITKRFHHLFFLVKYAQKQYLITFSNAEQVTKGFSILKKLSRLFFSKNPCFEISLALFMFSPKDSIFHFSLDTKNSQNNHAWLTVFEKTLTTTPNYKHQEFTNYSK